MSRLAIIGGSGLSRIPGVGDVVSFSPEPTAWGQPNAAFSMSEAGDIIFMSRHGKGHQITPDEINYRANIAALKALGVTQIVSMSAVGGLVEEASPGTLVMVDQFIDRTVSRKPSFFGEGIVAHVSLADPTCKSLRQSLLSAADEAGVSCLAAGTYLAMEGPQFSTRAESVLYRSWGASVIGMTNMPEARLAREAEICYQTVAMVTDYDAWRPVEEVVSVEAVLRVLEKNALTAKKLLEIFLQSHHQDICHEGCRHALDHAVITDPGSWPQPTVAKLSEIAPRIFS